MKETIETNKQIEKIALPVLETKESEIDLPGSKSISNRVLLLSALSKDTKNKVKRVLKSDDTDRMLEALEKLWVKIEKISDDEVIIYWTNWNFKKEDLKLFLWNAWTAFRSLTAVLAILWIESELSWISRMHQRPIWDLVDALRQVWANIDYLENEGFPPLKIKHFQENQVNTLQVKWDVYSQFLSALLIALPLNWKSYEIQIDWELISKPYVDITLNLLKKFGVEIKNDSYKSFKIPANSLYKAPEEILVEWDASSASYFMAAGLLWKNKIKINWKK